MEAETTEYCQCMITVDPIIYNRKTTKRKLSGFIVCSEHYVKEIFKHMEVCPEAKQKASEVWFAYYGVANRSPGGVSQTMLKALKRAARKIAQPDVTGFLAALEVNNS